MNAEILCVGTEILLGDIVNTNAAYLAKELAVCGIGCYYQSVVGDNPERLKTSLILALSRADIVITTGGLGPTYDDLTKETVAEYFGLEMEIHQPTVDKLKVFFERVGREMTPNNAKQAQIPKGSVLLENDRGTAPGVAVEKDGKIVIMLPGPPREMTAMFENQAKPFLLERSQTVIVSHTVNLFGIGESTVEHTLKEFMQSHSNPTIAPYAKEGEVQLRVTASAKNEDIANEMIKPVLAEIEKNMRGYVYGIDVISLENSLVQKLKAANKTIALAESCTGGTIASRITEIAGSSDVFHCGVCSYSNDIKVKILNVKQSTLEEFGAVSEQTALEMAKGVRNLANADIGLSVTGIAGPTGGSEEKPIGLVYIGISTKKGDSVTKLQLGRGYGGERKLIRTLASSNALHLAIKAI